MIGRKAAPRAKDPILILALDNGGGIVRAHQARRGRLQIRDDAILRQQIEKAAASRQPQRQNFSARQGAA